MWKVVIALIVLTASPAYAQHNHDEGHPEYREWSSGRTWNCCNEKDCGDLNDDEVRETPTGTEVLVKTKDNAPKWCPPRSQGQDALLLGERLPPGVRNRHPRHLD